MTIEKVPEIKVEEPSEFDHNSVIAFLKYCEKSGNIPQWNEWRNKNLLQKIDLSKAELIGLNLSFINLVDCQLSFADFSETNLEGAKFTMSNLEGANFQDCELMEAQFQNTNMQGVNFNGSSLVLADFTNSQLSGSKFKHCNLNSTNFTNAILKGVNFSHANLVETVFNGADLRVAEMVGVDFHSIKYDGALFTGVNISSAKINEIDMTQFDLTAATLDGVEATNANFEGMSITNLKVRHSTLNGANFVGSNLKSCDFSESSLMGCDFTDAVVSNGNFSQANLENAYCKSANFEGANFEDAILEGCDLRATNLRDVNFDGADLTNANLNGAILDGTGREHMLIDESRTNEFLEVKEILDDFDLIGKEAEKIEIQHTHNSFEKLETIEKIQTEQVKVREDNNDGYSIESILHLAKTLDDFTSIDELKEIVKNITYKINYKNGKFDSKFNEIMLNMALEYQKSVYLTLLSYVGKIEELSRLSTSEKEYFSLDFSVENGNIFISHSEGISSFIDEIYNTFEDGKAVNTLFAVFIISGFMSIREIREYLIQIQDERLKSLMSELLNRFKLSRVKELKTKAILTPLVQNNSIVVTTPLRVYEHRDFVMVKNHTSKKEEIKIEGEFLVDGVKALSTATPIFYLFNDGVHYEIGLNINEDKSKIDELIKRLQKSIYTTVNVEKVDGEIVSQTIGNIEIW